MQLRPSRRPDSPVCGVETQVPCWRLPPEALAEGSLLARRPCAVVLPAPRRLARRGLCRCPARPGPSALGGGLTIHSLMAFLPTFPRDPVRLCFSEERCLFRSPRVSLQDVVPNLRRAGLREPVGHSGSKGAQDRSFHLEFERRIQKIPASEMATGRETVCAQKVP